ncbi:MAG: cytochrome b/b6 domain-containing protein [Gammaproteobacteria bacterium]|jgi:cytochrome b|nr:cytochrome b/b6 domain-containing protein [Gammaproteobacteria bacterium]
MNTFECREYRVWDRVVRVFHWINLLTVLGLAGIGLALLNGKALGLSAEGKLLLKTLHVWIGYVFAANLLVRLVWACGDNPHAGWRDLLPAGPAFRTRLKRYLLALRGRTSRPYLGHNPAGRLMVTLLLGLLLVQGFTGMVLAGTDIYYPPLGGWIAHWVAAPGVDPALLVPGDRTLVDTVAYADMRRFREPFITVHECAFYLLMLAVALHVAGVVVAELREGGGLISAMITGRKRISGRPEDAPDAER